MEESLGNRPSISVVLALPPTLNQSYKIVEIKGYSRLALSEEASEYKDETAVLAFQALTPDFPVRNGPGGGNMGWRLTKHGQVCCDYVERSNRMSGEGFVSIKVESSLPPTLNQSYKIVEIKGVSRLALNQDALDFKDQIAILAFQALTKEFPVINGTGEGSTRWSCCSGCRGMQGYSFRTAPSQVAKGL